MIPDSITEIFERARGTVEWRADEQGGDVLHAEIDKRILAIGYSFGHPWLKQFLRFRQNIWPRGYAEPDLEFADAVDDGVAEFAERLAEIAGTIAICQRELALRGWPN